MAYLKTILKGRLGTTEVWSTGNSWGIVGLSPDTPDQPLVDGVLARLRTYTIAANVPTSLKTLLSTQGTIIGWRVEKRAEDETILSVAEGNMTTPVPGTSAATKTPQDAYVFSLRTTTPGARGRGRMYWPALAASIDSGFAITGPTPAAAIADMKTWLNAIGTEINAYYIAIGDIRRVVLAVRSGTDHVSRDVNQIQGGSVLDTQRRRRDALFETYVSTTYP